MTKQINKRNVLDELLLKFETLLKITKKVNSLHKQHLNKYTSRNKAHNILQLNKIRSESTQNY